MTGGPLQVRLGLEEGGLLLQHLRTPAGGGTGGAVAASIRSV